MLLSEYVLECLADEGVDTAFLVYGGAITELVEAFTRQKRIRYVVPMHEQAAGFMAEGYAKARGGVGCAIATSGPGAHNLVTAIANAWYDSVPMVFITGQVNTAFMRADDSMRQLGFQETPIAEIVRPITKSAWTVKTPSKALVSDVIAQCRTGRPGPVLLDLPTDVQKMEAQ